MIKIDLITGFLGSGKTTFIKKYAKYLMAQNLNIGILENDFGAVNVDVMLLQDIVCDKCTIEMVSGGCDADCHKRRFKTKLIAMGMSGYDRIIVEPSGIFDIDEFFDTLHEEPLDRWYEIGNVIAIVDASLENNLSKEADYLLASQIANAGNILLSKTKEASDCDITDTIAHLNRVLKQIQCNRRFSDDTIIRKDWENLTPDDFSNIENCGFVTEKYTKLWFDNQDIFTSLYFMNMHMSESELCSAAKAILQDTACGNVFRIKGFLQLPDHTWIELNATHKKTTTKPIPKGQEIVIVIGENLNQDIINAYWKQ